MASRVKLAIITGSGLYQIDSLQNRRTTTEETPFGAVDLEFGLMSGVSVVVYARHGKEHERLSCHVNYRALFYALRELRVEAVVATSVVGCLRPELELARVVLFDELYFPENRLPNGELCTLFSPGDGGRGHFIPTDIFSVTLREAMSEVCESLQLPYETRGGYAHVNGPRLNTAVELRPLRNLGLTAVSQTAGPEAVLAGEVGIPYALVGFLVDYAAGVTAEPTPLDVLTQNLAKSKIVFQSILKGLAERLDERELPFDTGVFFPMGT